MGPTCIHTRLERFLVPFSSSVKNCLPWVWNIQTVMQSIWNIYDDLSLLYYVCKCWWKVTPLTCDTGYLWLLVKNYDIFYHWEKHKSCPFKRGDVSRAILRDNYSRTSVYYKEYIYGHHLVANELATLSQNWRKMAGRGKCQPLHLLQHWSNNSKM